MPVTMDKNRVPPSWATRNPPAHSPSADTRTAHSEPIRIALVNNMPDSALEDTELQFCELLEAAAGDLSIHVKLFSLPELARSERARQHLSRFYSSVDELRKTQFDGAIITGTEPLQPDLRNEPYWRTLSSVLDWAEENTNSTVLSCLAAHAGVLHSDRIPRNRLPEKQFGVFDHQQVADHDLMRGIPSTVRIPHSRWNEVREDALAAHGYTVLTKAPNAGVDLFVKQKKNSLFVHFQGHPEYGHLTLLKEYQRDIRRFLKHERETYPSMPEGYFDAKAAENLIAFRDSALNNPDMHRMKDFPEAAVLDSLQNTWQVSAAGVYRNWLGYLTSRQSISAPGSMAHVGRK
jgi:homoserine O-succinyltransferase/O-acetyltransferase